MKIIKKLKWVLTWMAMAMLKRSLRYLISGENTFWLQNVRANDISIFNRIDFILDQCIDKRILHIGFSDHPFTLEKISNGSLLHLQIQKITNSVMGLDIDKNTIRQYREITKDENVVYGDITLQYPLEATDFKPEIILLSEVLEHLEEPYKAIEVLYKSFPGGTKVLVTVPNYTSLDCLAASFNKTESIHPLHHWYFSPYTLRRLFDDKRFELEQLHFGMYYQPKSSINMVLKNYPFNGDCIIALVTIIKNKQHV